MAEPGGAAQRREKAKRGGMAGFFIGLVLGAVGAIFVPGLAGPYMPAALRGDEMTVSGVVQSKTAEPERLLLTVASDAGAMLVTFKKKVTEIDQLVSVGDSVQLAVDEYAPFVDKARISRVMKRSDWHPAAEAAARSGDSTASPDAGRPPPTEGAMETTDTMRANQADSTEAGDSLPSISTP